MKIIVLKKKTVALFTFIIAVAIFLTVTAGSIIVGANAKRKLPIYSVKTSEKKIAISFDCAWGTDYTDKLLSIMEEKGVKCTFFMVEFWAEKFPDYVMKINEKGHEIGTHSATHPYMSKLSKEQIISELTTSKRAIEDITGKVVKTFRPPYGDYNDLLIETAESLNLYVIQWDVDSLDWKNISATEIQNRVLKKVKNGSIVLFHNNGLHTAESLPKIIDELKGRGYEFVTIYDLIYKDNYEMSIDGTQIEIGKT